MPAARRLALNAREIQADVVIIGGGLGGCAAAVIGGAALSGGVGTATGAIIGAALIEIIRNSLGLLGINAFWQVVLFQEALALAGRIKRFDHFHNLAHPVRTI